MRGTQARRRDEEPCTRGVQMKYNRFEDLPVWNAALELAVRTYALSAKAQFRNQHSLRDQIERAAVSVSNNIAEGFERGTTQELLTFLYIARGVRWRGALDALLARAAAWVCGFEI